MNGAILESMEQLLNRAQEARLLLVDVLENVNDNRPQREQTQRIISLMRCQEALLYEANVVHLRNCELATELDRYVK